MRCQDIMKSEVESFRVNDSVLDVARQMRDMNFGFAPVCGPDGRPVGTVTDRDIAVRVCAEDRPARGTHVGDVMTHETVTVSEADDVARAEELMAEHHKSRIMVVNGHGRLVGVISLSDLAAEESDDRVASTMRRVAERESRP